MRVMKWRHLRNVPRIRPHRGWARRVPGLGSVEAHDHEVLEASQSTSIAQAAAFEPSHTNDKDCGERGGGAPGTKCEPQIADGLAAASCGIGSQNE